MSVIGYTSQEIGQVARAVFKRADQDCFYWDVYERREIKELSALLEKWEWEIRESGVFHLFDRLFMGNQIAFYYTYGKGDFGPFTRLQDDDFERVEMSDMELLKNLQLLDYNLYSNSGHCFVGQEDTDKLKSLIETLKSHILKDMY